ncbi:uncharacterized protein LOC121875857 [Homarus americanus]|uniref:uncharacterized protein LOC121875857 n=1 Tax=Homarus americanus TaxID=6706 RepID=UPI001C48CBB6|nr:uncharacterized protein LOC121875857 [Homarus americanus]
MACLRAWVGLTTLLTFAFFVTTGATMQCFLCSYSPRSNSSRIDGCTDGNFTEEQTESRSCDLGCEAVTVYDLNGEVESFHRNCATEDTLMTNSCGFYKTIILTRYVCTCDWSYCNTASSQMQVFRPGLLMLLGPAVTWLGLSQRLLTV